MGKHEEPSTVTGAVWPQVRNADQVITAQKYEVNPFASVIKDVMQGPPLQHHDNTHAATRFCTKAVTNPSETSDTLQCGGSTKRLKFMSFKTGNTSKVLAETM